MAVKIRLRRMGEKNLPFYRVVVTDTRYPQTGRFLETIGWYDPKKKTGSDIKLDMDRVNYWASQGAQMSVTVKDLVKKVSRNTPPKAPRKAEAEPESVEA